MVVLEAVGVQVVGGKTLAPQHATSVLAHSGCYALRRRHAFLQTLIRGFCRLKGYP